MLDTLLRERKHFCLYFIMNIFMLQRKKHKKREPIVASSGKEAIAMLIQEKKISTKINYDVLNDLKVEGTRKKSLLIPSLNVFGADPSTSTPVLKR